MRTASRGVRSCSTSTPPTIRCTAIRRGGFPWLLRLLLLPAALRLLRPASSGRQASTLERRRQRGRGRGDGAHRRPDPGALAKEVDRLHADSGFAREALMVWCEAHKVDYVFGLARNERLEARVAAGLAEARRRSEAADEKPARVFGIPVVNEGLSSATTV